MIGGAITNGPQERSRPTDLTQLYTVELCRWNRLPFESMTSVVLLHISIESRGGRADWRLCWQLELLATEYSVDEKGSVLGKGRYFPDNSLRNIL